MIRMVDLDRVPTSAEAGKCDIVTWATEPFLGLRPVVTGFLAAMCVVRKIEGLTSAFGRASFVNCSFTFSPCHRVKVFLFLPISIELNNMFV